MNHDLNVEDEKRIALSKSKLRLLFVGAVLFVAMGIWMVQLDVADIEAHSRYNNPVMMHGIGVVAILFFGLCAVFGARKLLDNRPGLILNSTGLLDNSSAVAAGFVPWSEVVGFSIFEVQNQKTLVVRVREPGRYIAAGGMFKRILNRMNYKLCGSPVVISANSLKLGFDELLKISQTYLHRYGDK
ncbi:hypothetical protein UNDYM_1679 [Undibacterium sp. YM2]|uniref:STM3941 family protein n=1 Tax=Undibacterium sp. YM2 TaxID=2058625 RepID=UPI001331F419|nr:STM3941 family protein [Undibacterium sp. YM2]BBB65932.1 hypothetical protein UNDYM_1679 [Undibacterium sp. YM2]